MSIPSDPAAGSIFPQAYLANTPLAPEQVLADYAFQRITEVEQYASDWISKLLSTLEVMQDQIDALKAAQENTPPQGEALSFRQLIELHHLKIIDTDEIRLLLGIPDSISKLTSEWTSLFTFDSEPKTYSAGATPVDVIPTTEADSETLVKSFESDLDVLFPPSPPEPDL